MDFEKGNQNFWLFRNKFYDRRKEVELLNDCIDEALVKRSIPTTIALSTATYFAIRSGYLKNNGIRGLMVKNLICMGIGLGVGLIGIQKTYNKKLEIFYNSHLYREVQNKFLKERPKYSDYSESFDNGSSNTKHNFVQPDYLNLDMERPDFQEINRWQVSRSEEQQKYVTYEELQQKNRELYAQNIEKMVLT